jgi:hypothetical protein
MMKTPLPPAVMLLCAFPLLLAGCAGTAASPHQPATVLPAPLPSAENISLGQRAYADGPIIEAARILEDSRCPQNARCVWAGRLKLQMIWHRGNGTAQPFELTLGEITHIADGHIEITAATPPRLAEDGPLLPDSYRFSFRFQGGR